MTKGATWTPFAYIDLVVSEVVFEARTSPRPGGRLPAPLRLRRCAGWIPLTGPDSAFSGPAPPGSQRNCQSIARTTSFPWSGQFRTSCRRSPEDRHPPQRRRRRTRREQAAQLVPRSTAAVGLEQAGHARRLEHLEHRRLVADHPQPPDLARVEDAVGLGDHAEAG